MEEYPDARLTDFKRPTAITGPKKGVVKVGPILDEVGLVTG